MLKINEYFEGNVKSISFNTVEGPATAGVMKAGKYEFSTSTKEIIIVTAGKITVKLPGADNWKEFNPFEKFEVPSNQKFQLDLKEDASYICYYK